MFDGMFFRFTGPGPGRVAGAKAVNWDARRHLMRPAVRASLHGIVNRFGIVAWPSDTWVAHVSDAAARRHVKDRNGHITIRKMVGSWAGRQRHGITPDGQLTDEYLQFVAMREESSELAAAHNRMAEAGAQ